MSRLPRLDKTCGFCQRDFRQGDQVERKGGMVVHLRCPKPSEEASAPVAAPPVAQEGAKARGRVRLTQTVSFDSGLEERYFAHLQQRLRRGEIAAVACKPEKLRLADGAHFTPDFRVVTVDGYVEFHETKGFMREAARVRLLVAAELHPYAFFLVFDKGDGEFVVQPHDAKPPPKRAKPRKKRA